MKYFKLILNIFVVILIVVISIFSYYTFYVPIDKAKESKKLLKKKEESLVNFNSQENIDKTIQKNNNKSKINLDAQKKQANIKSKSNDIDVENEENFDELEIDILLSVVHKTEYSNHLNMTIEQCVSKGGRIRLGMCEAKWEEAIKICESQNKQLYPLDELEKIILNCGGIISDYFSKWSEDSYTECYKGLEFSSNEYWTSSDIEDMKNFVYVIRFSRPSYYLRYKKSHSNVVCRDK